MGSDIGHGPAMTVFFNGGGGPLPSVRIFCLRHVGTVPRTANEAQRMGAEGVVGRDLDAVVLVPDRDKASAKTLALDPHDGISL